METPKTTPKDFFLYVGAIITLYWSAGALIALLFTIIDTSFRDALNVYVDPYSGGIRFAIASLIVVFPVSLSLLRTVKKEAIRTPQKLSLPLRRWLYAFTIFITSIAMAGDIIALLNSFLGGELTTRFILKVVSVIVVAGIIFWFCLSEIRVRAGVPVRMRKEFLWGSPILVFAAIACGFAVMGSPTTIRSLRLDSQRVSNLQDIQWRIVNYWQQKGVLPAALEDLRDPISGFVIPLDPRTGEEYEFVKGKEQAFRLCATFEKADPVQGGGTTEVPRGPVKPVSVSSNENWYHESGRYCFDRKIDPELYPVRPKNP